MGCGASTEQDRRKEQRMIRAKLSLARRAKLAQQQSQEASSRLPDYTPSSSFTPSDDEGNVEYSSSDERELSHPGSLHRVDTMELVLGVGEDTLLSPKGGRRDSGGGRRSLDGNTSSFGLRRKPSKVAEVKYERDPTFGSIELVDSDSDGETEGHETYLSSSDGGELTKPLRRVSGSNSPTSLLPAPTSPTPIPRQRRSASKESSHSDLLATSQETLELRSRLSQQSPKARKFSRASGSEDGTLHRCESGGTLSSEPSKFSSSIQGSIRTLVAKVRCSDHEFDATGDLPPLSPEKKQQVANRVASWQEDLSFQHTDGTVVEEL